MGEYKKNKTLKTNDGTGGEQHTTYIWRETAQDTLIPESV